MFDEIVVPVDLTPKNERAVEVARDLALRCDSKVLLLHVIETLELPFEELREFYDRLQARAITYMDGLSRMLEAAGVAFEVHVEFGDRASRIVRQVHDRESDLLIMDSHVVGPGSRGPSTISYKVAVMADCPVLLVKGAKGGAGTAS